MASQYATGDENIFGDASPKYDHHKSVVSTGRGLKQSESQKTFEGMNNYPATDQNMVVDRGDPYGESDY